MAWNQNNTLKDSGPRQPCANIKAFCVGCSDIGIQLPASEGPEGRICPYTRGLDMVWAAAGMLKGMLKELVVKIRQAGVGSHGLSSEA